MSFVAYIFKICFLKKLNCKSYKNKQVTEKYFRVASVSSFALKAFESDKH